MLDAPTFAALVERCAAGQTPAPIAAIVRRASGFEPLVLTTIQSGKPLSVQAMSKEEGIALASEMKLAGQPVRIGLAGIDTRDLDWLGVGLGDAFEACTNISAAARLLIKNPNALQPLAAASNPRSTRPARQEQQAPQPSPDLPGETAELSEPRVLPPPRAWDVYGRAGANSILVYGSTE